MKSDDLISVEEARQNLQKAADDLSSAAKSDRAALDIGGEGTASDVQDKTISDITAAEPSAAGWLDNSNYENHSEGLGPQTASSFDNGVTDAKRTVLNQLANGIQTLMPIVIQEAIDTIDDLRNLADEIAAEAAKISAAAVAGLLIPPLAGDVEDFGDSIDEARTQARVIHADIANARARRDAAQRLANGDAGEDLSPQVRALPGRPIVRSVGITESNIPDDAGISLISGSQTQADRAAVSDDHVRRMQTLLRSSMTERISYIAICAALNSMTRGQASRDQAVRTVEKLKRILDSISSMIDGGFADSIADAVQEFANSTLESVEASLQSKLDSVDDFLKTIAGLPGPFVATVRQIGDVPDQAPVLNFFASQCKIKGAKFCDMQGLLEVAQSLDIDLGLQIPQLPMVGRAILTLDAPEPDQVAFGPHAQDVPQEADLILFNTIAVSGVHAQGRFAKIDRRVVLDEDGATQEVPDVFGSGPGQLTFLADDESVVETRGYSSVSFDPLTGIYDFTMSTPATVQHIPTLLGNVDVVVFPSFWDDTVIFDVGSNEITVRIPEPARSDIDLNGSGRIVLGIDEQDSFRGQYDASVASTIRTFEDVFEAWHVGKTVQITDSLGVLQTRTIATFVNARTVTYSGGNVPSTLPMSRGSVQFTARHFEIVSYTNIRPAFPSPTLPGQDQLFILSLSSLTTIPHARLTAAPQKSVRVVPDVRDEFLDAAETPANPDMRASQRVLPAGSTIVKGTYEDASQDAYFTPILVAAVSGSMFINGQGPIAYSLVEDLSGPRLKFTVPLGTPISFSDGDIIEVLATDMLDRFKVDFPDNWTDALDNWLRGLLAEFNKMEAKFCRLLSGSSQDIATSAAAVAVGATSVSLLLTTARFILVAWLTPMLVGPEMERSLARLRSLGATNAETAIREGRVSDFATMSSDEATPAGAAMGAAQVLASKADSQEQFNAISRMTAELRGQYESALIAASVAVDLQTAQAEEVARREQGAQALKKISEDV